MKKLIVTSIIALLLLGGNTAIARNRPDDYLGLPGDNLNLYAVMKLFQESKTLEDFERGLNDQNSRINNLDLNGDNLIDYISVIDHPDGDVHNIVMQVALSRTEKQDVAVFTVQRFHNGSVQIQLIGDESLYGKNYIIEPNYAQTPNPGYVGTTTYVDNSPVVSYTAFEIAAWPLVSFLYLPGYIAWHSLWYWDYWPSYWHPWHPYYWDYYYGYHYNCFPDYYSHYHHADYYRYHGYHNFYYSDVRSHSDQVNRRIREGDYRNTYSHPEQRREGEALYTRLNAGQTTRRGESTSVNNQGRHSGSQLSTERRNAGNSFATSRGSATVTDRKSPATKSVQSGNSTRRSFSTSSARPNTSARPVQNVNSNHRSSITTTDRKATSSNVRSPRNSTPSFSARAGSRSDQGSRGPSARSFSQSAPKASASAPRSSSKSSSSGNSGHSSGGRTSSGGSKDSNSSHRR